MNAHRIGPAWIVVGAGVAAAMHVGKLPTALPVLRESLGVTLVQAGFLLALVQFAGMLLGLAVGLAADSLGLRRTMAAGLALLAVASALGAFAQSPSVMMLLRGVEGFGFLLASMPAPSLIRRLVRPERVNAALGLWGGYMPLGTALALLAGPPGMAWVGWRGWWVVLAAVAAMMALVLTLSLPPDRVPAASAALHGWPKRLRATLRARGPWLVALCFGVYSAQWLSVIGFLPTVYAQAGLTAAAAGAATALAALVNMIGNVAAGRLLQHGIAASRLLACGFAAMALGAVATFSELNGVIRYGGVLVFSMLGGLIPGTLFSLAVRVAPGDDTVSTTVGWMQQWSACGQFAGPPIVAWVAAQSGGWQYSGFVTAAFAAIGLILAATTARVIRSRPDKI